MINDEVWVATGDWNSALPKVEVLFEDTTAVIKAVHGPNPDRLYGIVLRFRYPHSPGSAKLVSAGVSEEYKCVDCGTITFTTIDTVRHVLAGTFEFILPDPSDTVESHRTIYHFTDGRFDVTWP